MSKKQASPERYAELNGGRPVTFVNYDMPDGEKKQYKKWLGDQNEQSLFVLIDSLVGSGYAISIKHDEYNDCEAAYITTQQEGNQNRALILSGRGRSVLTAAANALFKHFVLFDAQWPEATSRKKPTDEE